VFVVDCVPSKGTVDLESTYNFGPCKVCALLVPHVLQDLVTFGDTGLEFKVSTVMLHVTWVSCLSFFFVCANTEYEYV
jgi:hypothetical protein